MIRLDAGSQHFCKFITGANWSVGISIRSAPSDPPARGSRALAKVRANASQPNICAASASAYLQYADRGKSSIILTDNARQPDISDPAPAQHRQRYSRRSRNHDKWTKQKKSEERHPSMVRARVTADQRAADFAEDAAWEVMEAAWPRAPATRCQPWRARFTLRPKIRN
jgi:hypothetical protein